MFRISLMEPGFGTIRRADILTLINTKMPEWHKGMGQTRGSSFKSAYLEGFGTLSSLKRTEANIQ